MTKDLEARLLASVPTINQFQALEEKGIVESSFQFYGPMYHYIAEIIAEHNHLPRLVDLRATFNVPDHVQRKPEEYDWLLEEFLSLSIVQRIQETMDRGVEEHGDSPRELLPALIKDLTELSIPDQRAVSISDKSAMDRAAKYESLQGAGDMIIGIPTGIRHFDADYRIGWIPGELNGIIGRLYVGKSWMLMYHGLKAWISGKRVLFISPEMPKEEAEGRLDTLMCGMLGVHINYTDIIRGYKPTPEQREIFKTMADRGDWVTLTSSEGRPFKLGELPRYVRQYEPDIMLIDGLLLIGGDSGGSKKQAFEHIMNLSYGLKNIAVGTDTVILVAHQANREAKDTSKAPGLHEIYMGDSFGQAADRVLVLSKPKGHEDILRVTVQKFRKGKPLVDGTEFKFQPINGIIQELELQDNFSEVADAGEIIEEEILPIP